MKIDLVFITYNRLEYTKLALASILADPTENFSLTVWDNASTDGTVEYLKNEINDSHISDIIFSKENIGQAAAVNQIWNDSKADLLGKLDNDCLVTPGWTRTLVQAHNDIDNLGVIACWHFLSEDFDESAARKAGKIQSFGKHQILRHPWTCGTGFLIKRELFSKFGDVPTQGGMTRYWLKIALKGYVNGYCYPFVYQEHMDDPKSSHCMLTDDESIQRLKNTTFVLRQHNINSMAERWRRREMVLRNINSDPWDARYYTGVRKKIQRIKERASNFIWRLQNWQSRQ